MPCEWVCALPTDNRHHSASVMAAEYSFQQIWQHQIVRISTTYSYDAIIRVPIYYKMVKADWKRAWSELPFRT